MKPPFDDDAAVEKCAVVDLDEASMPDLPETIWVVYDADGNSQIGD